jgi:CRISPR/Cas system-associated exonuclease Cas4 (RecB family)
MNSDLPSVLRTDSVFVDDGWRLDPHIERYLESLNEAPTTRASGIYSPSQLHGCERALFYNRIGVPRRGNVDPETRFTFDFGHSIHKLLNRYVQDIFGGEVQVERFVSLPMYNIQGELDMILLHRGTGRGRRIIDFKSISSKSFGKLSKPTILKDGSVSPVSMTGYVWQLHAYMAAEDVPLGTIYYVCKDNAERFEAPIVFSHALWERIEERIISVEQAIEAQSPPSYSTNKWYCKGCDWLQHCQPPGVTIKRPPLEVVE